MAGTGARFKIESILDSAGHLCGTAPPSPLSVRYFSARSGSVPGYDDGEGLKLELPLAQSAFVCGGAENRDQHCPRRSHAILADTVGVTLQGQPNITVA